MKTCTKCGVLKPVADFYFKKETKDGRRYACKECHNKQATEWLSKNRTQGRIITRRSMLKLNYGLTLEQYDELLTRQNYSCAICNRNQSEFKNSLAVDHDHSDDPVTGGVVRGLLCDDCNRHVIGRRRNPELFYRAAKYLEGPFTGWHVPKKKKRRTTRKRRSS